ncbi:carbon monoxide dehydrogenase subunit G [Tepidicaulis marinus]|uniref:Carbon monoxide dehydrogenase subunit G n=1 Tax=Tepidicaulis marinus TaxID=1333998 RepID=A0A081B7P4_9HYPH|nr:carbon monoxide dehydrogenase subunit G [Tepidicaulis marinus]GAK44062.1 carbon monoxide dehydrogenase subunit G [Tepidicaulis marinus]
MDMSGEVRIPAPRETVWDALNDPSILQQAIPGAETVEKTSDTEFEAAVKAKVGPVSAKFKGKVTLSDINAPAGYTISGEGSGGAAGFAKGSAKVDLVEDGSDTIVKYEVHATVGGKLAQIGQRLIDSTAKKMADEFFANLRNAVAGPVEADRPGAHPESDAVAPTDAPMLPNEDAGMGLAPWMWGTLVILGVLIVIYFVGT